MKLHLPFLPFTISYRFLAPGVKKISVLGCEESIYVLSSC